MVPVGYLVGYVPTKKFKKDVRSYCQTQYNLMISQNNGVESNRNEKNTKKYLNQQQLHTKSYLPSSSLAMGHLTRVKKSVKTKKNTDYYTESIITFSDSDGSDESDEDNCNNDRKKMNELNNVKKKMDEAKLVESFRVYKMRGNARIDVMPGSTQQPDKQCNNNNKNRVVINDVSKLGIGTASRSIHL